MERVKLKIKRLETIESILEAYAKRKSGMVKQEALLREEKQKGRVKELEERLKIIEAGWKRDKDLRDMSYELADEIKKLEGQLRSEDLETLDSDHDALRKVQAELLKNLVKKKRIYDKLLKIGENVITEEKKRLAVEIDVERAKVKQLEQNRKEIEKGVYLTLKEGLRKKFASDIDVERAKLKQLEQNSMEFEKGTLKEGHRKKLASNVDIEHANDGQILALPGLPMSMEEATPFNMVNCDKNATIQIGEMIVPLVPKQNLLAAQAEKPAAKKP